jgi:hypothetical protein
MENDKTQEVPFNCELGMRRKLMAEREKKELHEAVQDYRLALKDRDFVAMANLAACYIARVSEDHGYQYAVEHFGACPQCLKTDGCYHVGRDEWFVCHERKVKWHVGSNLFSCWRDMTEEQFEANFKMLAGYREIEPIHLVEGPYPESETAGRLCSTLVEGPKPHGERSKAREDLCL